MAASGGSVGAHMRVAAAVAKGKLQLEARPIPFPRDGEVLLRVEACGLCRSDTLIVDGTVRGSQSTTLNSADEYHADSVLTLLHPIHENSLHGLCGTWHGHA